MADAIPFPQVGPSSAVAVRRCKKCGEEKAETEFYVKNKKTGLLMLKCKACVCADRKAYIEAHPERRSYLKPEIKERKLARWRDNYWADPEKYRAIGRATYHKRRPEARAHAKQKYYENPKSAIAKSAKWNRENPDRVKAWVEANRPRIRAAQKKYNLLHPEVHVLSRHIRRARKRAATVERIKPGIYDRLMAWQKGACPYCHISLDKTNRHLDHLIPLSRGGKHIELNLQLTCKKCNLRKHAKHPLDFAAEMGIVQNPIYVAI